MYIRYTPSEVYNVVSNVDEYCQFLPWVLKSRTLTSNGKNKSAAELLVGFQPLAESYVSNIYVIPNKLVK
eukprot:Ihof_evm4s270 gene=Ihof_evmTU4s270